MPQCPSPLYSAGLSLTREPPMTRSRHLSPASADPAASTRPERVAPAKKGAVRMCTCVYSIPTIIITATMPSSKFTELLDVQSERHPSQSSPYSVSLEDILADTRRRSSSGTSSNGSEEESSSPTTATPTPATNNSKGKLRRWTAGKK